MKIKLKNIFKLKNILIVALFLISLIIIGVTYKLSYSMKTVASSAGNYTREEVENMVVATALSYYRNKKYSEFDQNSMDNKDTIRWRNFNISPELMNRTNYYQGDYSSFVASVYMHSLGYDFSDYFELTGSTYYNFDTSTNTFISKLAKTSKDNFKEAYSLYGKGIDTNFFTKIGKKIADNNDYTAGTEYENDNNDNVVVYFYEVTGEETSEEQKQIKENLISNLKPGDIVVYRAEVNGSPAGNAVLYIGDAIDNEEGYKGGFIRSYGSDYSVKDDGVTIGDDRHSIRYEGMYQLWDNLFPDSTTKTSTSFTVLRPINSYCKDDNCTLDEKSSPNLAARVDLSGLTIEQYASKSNIEANVVIDGDLNVVDKEKLTILY